MVCIPCNYELFHSLQHIFGNLLLYLESLLGVLDDPLEVPDHGVQDVIFGQEVIWIVFIRYLWRGDSNLSARVWPLLLECCICPEQKLVIFLSCSPTLHEGLLDQQNSPGQTLTFLQQPVENQDL